jgi:hypothetical protein
LNHTLSPFVLFFFKLFWLALLITEFLMIAF